MVITCVSNLGKMVFEKWTQINCTFLVSDMCTQIEFTFMVSCMNVLIVGMKHTNFLMKRHMNEDHVAEPLRMSRKVHTNWVHFSGIMYECPHCGYETYKFFDEKAHEWISCSRIYKNVLIVGMKQIQKIY